MGIQFINLWKSDAREFEFTLARLNVSPFREPSRCCFFGVVLCNLGIEIRIDGTSYEELPRKRVTR